MIIALGEKVFGALLVITGAAIILTGHWTTTDDTAAAHHDALEFPDGEIMLLTLLCEGQQATVLQLPAEPKAAVESEAERRAADVS